MYRLTQTIFLLSIFTCLFTPFHAIHCSPYTDFQGELFVAIPVPETVQDDIEILQNQLKDPLGDTFIPSKLSNLHVTIQVIGKTANLETLDKIDNLLSGIHNSPFSLGTELHSGRLVIKTKNVKLNLSSDALTAFANKVRNILIEGGITVSKRFDYPNNAHITIGTIRHKKIHKLKRVEKTANETFNELKQTFQSFSAEHFIVNTFTLLKSNYPLPIKERIYAPIRVYELE